MMHEWARKEFAAVDFGDKRLNKRLVKVGQRFFEKPMSSINGACESWKDTKAAYRLFNNDKVSSAEILSAHRQEILTRIRKEERIFAIQDTTFFNYHPHRARTDMGIIESKSRPLRGMLAHNVLIVSDDDTPLGLFHQKIYARNPKEKKPKWYERELEEKESYRWIEAVRNLAQQLPQGTACTVIADREGDIFEHFQTCIEQNLDFVIRSTYNRAVGQRKKRWEYGANQYLFDHLAKQKIEHKVVIEIYDSKLNKKRLAHLNLRFCNASLPAPWRINWSIHRGISNLEICIVELKEHHPPKGASKIHWRLLTSHPVLTIEQALDVVRIYQKRWCIETYHKVIKSGCKVEECRLGSRDSLEKFLTLCSIVAWRLYWMTKVSRNKPDQPCTIMFSPEEWKSIYKRTHSTPDLPTTLPTANEMLRAMAQMGGYLGRKSDGPPGIITIWRGWQQLHSHLSFKTYG